MGKRIKWFVVLLFATPMIATAQQDTTLSKKLDSLNKKADSLPGGQKNNIRREVYTDNTELNVRTYFILLGSDLKQEVTAPFHTKPKNWSKAGYFAAATIALSFLDENINNYAVNLSSHNKGVASTSRFVTNFGGPYEVYTLAALGTYGWVFKNYKLKTTTLLATQSYITSAVISKTLKVLTGRQRPIYYDPKTGKNEPTFHGPFYQFKKDALGNRPIKQQYNSFPSGHTTAAFAAATVFALEYRDRPLVPVLSYSIASLIGLSRLTENKHWPTDVLVGAALGFLTGRQVVYNYHRYAKVKAEEAKAKGKVSFNLQYNQGVFMPGLVYTFR